MFTHILFVFLLNQITDIRVIETEIVKNNVRDMVRARNSAKVEGVTTVVTNLYDDLEKTHLNLNNSKKQSRLRGIVLKNPSVYLTQTTDISETLSPDGVYKWKAKYHLDVSKILSAAKLVMQKLHVKVYYIYTGKKTISPEDKKALKQHFPWQVYRLDFRKGNLPTKCRVDACVFLEVTKGKVDSRTARWSYYVKKRRKKVITVKSEEKNGLFVAVPDEIKTLFRMETLKTTNFIITGITDPVELVKIAYILKKQDPGFIFMDSISLLHNGMKISYRLRPRSANNPGAGIFLGETVSFTRNINASGDVELNIKIPLTKVEVPK